MHWADQFATNAHKGQTRFDGSPYINHPRRVARVIYKFNGHDWETAVAYLHDVAEDTNITIDEIVTAASAHLYDDELTLFRDALTCLTKKPGDLYPDYLARLLDNPGACVIKYVDMLDNMTDLKVNYPKKKAQIDKYGVSMLLLAREHPAWIYEDDLKEIYYNQNPELEEAILLL